MSARVLTLSSGTRTSSASRVPGRPRHAAPRTVPERGGPGGPVRLPAARPRAGCRPRRVPSPEICRPPRGLTQKFPLNSDPVMAGARAGSEQSGAAAAVGKPGGHGG